MWDKKKAALMSSIILAQAEQHEEMAETLMEYKDKHIAETVICDGFWDVELPKIYKSVGRMLDAQYEQGVTALQNGKKRQDQSAASFNGEAADCGANPPSTATVEQPKFKKRRVA
eukprot:6387014-Prymnesium_polylepis.1